MGAPLLTLPNPLVNRRNFTVFDDFAYYVDANMWTKLASDTNSTVSAGSSDDGLLVLFTGDNTDNNEAAVKSTNKNFTLATSQTLVAESLINYTEGNTDDANVAFGFSSAVGANWLLDNGAGPAASQSAVMIYKVDGGTVWKACSQVGTNQTISTSTTTAGGNQVLRVEAQAQPDSTVACKFFVDDKVLLDSSTNLPIKHTILSGDVSSAAAMNIGAYVKAGGTTSNETLNVDYIGAAKTRDRWPFTP